MALLRSTTKLQLSLGMFATLVIGLAAYWYLTRIKDTYWSREIIADQLQQYRDNAREEPKNGAAMRHLIDATKSGNSFRRGYAIDMIRTLSDKAEDVVPLLGTLLHDPDSFIRGDAAHALLDLCRFAKPAKADLVETVRQYPSDSCGVYAARALECLGDDSDDVLEALRMASKTIAGSRARTAYRKLTGRDPE